jgi:undecaprenyl-diphosphatase
MPVVVAVCYALFTLAVHLRMLDALDITVRKAARPGDVWGPLQMRAAVVVQGLQPIHLVVPLLLAVAIVSLVRRSLRPFVVTAIVGGAAIVVTLGTKWTMSHTGANAPPVAHGHFPSGHTVSVIVAAGLLVLFLRPDSRWGWILPAFMGLLMGCSVVVIAMHPVSDAAGAILLAVAALATARLAGLGQWAAVRRTRLGEESSGG